MHASAAYILFVQRSREGRAEFATKAGEKPVFSRSIQPISKRNFRPFYQFYGKRMKDRPVSLDVIRKN